jgi:mono/diheme cytochrome c family protein
MKKTFAYSAAVLGLFSGGLVQGKLTPEQLKALPAAVTEPVVFSRDIKPIFVASCVQCHARGKAKGGLRLDERAELLKGGDSGAAVIPGNSAESLLVELVSGLNADNVMPMKGSRLSARQVALVRGWVDQGLPWEPGVSFAKPPPANLEPRRPALPAATRASGANPIDRFLWPYFAEHRVKPGKLVDDRTFARRVFLDAIGLVPSPEEMTAFSADKSPDKRELWSKKLLNENVPYAEHWLSFWNDLLRNDYKGPGYIDGGRKPITAWLYEALATNMAYNVLVSQLVAPPPEAEGFIKGIVWRGAVNASQTPQLQAAQNVAQVFMGANLKCASCHDSFVSDWTLADAYGMASVFDDHPLEMFKCDKATGEKTAARFMFPGLGDIPAEAPMAEKRKCLADILTSKQNGRFSRTIVNRLWERSFGRGLIEPLDDMEKPAWHPALLDWLAEDLVDHNYDLKRTLSLIYSSRAYQLPAANVNELASGPFVFRGPSVRRMSAEQFRDAIAQLGGVWHEKPAAKLSTNSVAYQAATAGRPAFTRKGQVRASLVAADPLALALGRPVREQVITSRVGTATTLQALEMTNGETLNKLLQNSASRLLTNGVTATPVLITQLFQRGLSRPPTNIELKLGSEQLTQTPREEALADFLWALVMQPEFQLIY